MWRVKKVISKTIEHLLLLDILLLNWCSWSIFVNVYSSFHLVVLQQNFETYTYKYHMTATSLCKAPTKFSCARSMIALISFWSILGFFCYPSATAFLLKCPLFSKQLTLFVSTSILRFPSLFRVSCRYLIWLSKFLKNFIPKILETLVQESQAKCYTFMTTKIIITDSSNLMVLWRKSEGNF